MKKVLLALFILLLLPGTALAQEETPPLTLGLNRDFGYGGFGNDIQGTFTMRASGPDTLTEVRFYIDDQLIGTITETPFNLQFNTDNYESGERDLYAIGVLEDGTELESNHRIQLFLSGEQAWDMMKSLLVPLLGIIVLVSVGGTVLPMLLGKKAKSRPVGEYSTAGGAVCKNCKLPFSRSMLSPNMLVGKLERCPHCDKWAVVARAGADALVEAEARLRADFDEGQAEVEISEEEKLRRMLDDSRFDG